MLCTHVARVCAVLCRLLAGCPLIGWLAAARVWLAVDFLHPKDASLSDKSGAVSGKLRIVKPVAAQPRRSHSRRQPSSFASSASLSSSALLSQSASSLVDSLSLTSTSTFPAAYTAPASPKQHTRRSVSSSALPSPGHTSAAVAAASAAVSATATTASHSSPAHQRAHTAEELSSPSPPAQPSTPRRDSTSSRSSTPPQSPSSADTPIRSTPPPTVRKLARADHDSSDSGHEADTTKRMNCHPDGDGEREGGEHGEEEGLRSAKEKQRLEEGEEESEELTNTTLADASLPESEDGDERRKRRQGGGGDGGAGGGDGGSGGGSRSNNDSANDTTDAINDILSFMRQSILSLSPAASASSSRLTIEQLNELSASALLALYKTVLSPVLSAHSEVTQLREEVSALRVHVKEAELGGLKECKRQVEKTKAELEAKYSDELHRLKDKQQRDKKASKDSSRHRRSGGEKLRSNVNVTASASIGSAATVASGSRHNTTLANVSYINQSLSFHEMSIDPTLSLTTDMLEPRTVTFTLSALDLATHSPQSNVTLALFSSRLASHSLWNFVGQTESRLPSSTAATALTFDRRLVMRDVKTWHARDKLRVSMYWVAVQKAGGEERKEMMGQVECDTYKLFTAFSSQSQPQQSVAWESLKAQETTDAIQGYSVRQLCVPLVDEHGLQCGSTRLLLNAHIAPPLTCDSYPPSPERVKRAGRGGALHLGSSLNLSLINDSLSHFNHSLAAPSFIENEPLSPIYPTKHSDGRRASSSKQRTAALDRTQRESETSVGTDTTARPGGAGNHSAATQCETVSAVECGAQTDTPVDVQRVYRDAGTMTDQAAVQAKPALSTCTQQPLSIEPSLTIVTGLEAAGVVSGGGAGGHSSCDNSPVVFHQESSACSSSSPSSPHHPSSACSSTTSSPTSSAAVPLPSAAVLLPTAASPLQATLMTLSAALSVPFPLPQAKLSNACQQSLHRILGLLRRQYSSSLQWFLDTAATAPAPSTAVPAASAKPSNKGGSGLLGTMSGASGMGGSGSAGGVKPTWNPSINPAAPSRLLSSIRLHSHWQPDSSVTSCSHCQSNFTLLKRKHHCRLCGSTACDECSKKCVELAELGLPGLQRVCDVCEMVWTAGKGLKAMGMPVVLLDVPVAAVARDDDCQPTHSKAAARPQPAAGKISKRSSDDGKQAKLAPHHDDELNVTASTKPQPIAQSSLAAIGAHTSQAAAHTTPTLARTARVRATPGKRLTEKEAAAAVAVTPAGLRRVTRSAAKENANVNVPPAIPEATPRRADKAKLAHAAPAAVTARTGRA